MKNLRILVPSSFSRFRRPFLLWRRSRKIKRLRNRFFSLPAVPENKPLATDRDLVIGRITVRYINLDTRPDRMSKVLKNLARIGIREPTRIAGVNGRESFPHLNSVLAGSIGCELAHISAISIAAPLGSDAIMVCEDDLEFTGTQHEINAVIRAFLSDPRLDVLCLSARPRGGSVAISEELRVAIGVVGRGCYLIKPHMVTPLVVAFGDGLRKLEKGDLSGKGDLIWRQLQENKFLFALPRKDLAQQSASFSDIEGRVLGPR